MKCPVGIFTSVFCSIVGRIFTFGIEVAGFRYAANVRDISVLIMELMVIPRPFPAGDGLNRMSLESISILVVGANRMFSMQLDSAIRRLDEILEQLTFPMLPSNEIDLPP
ncbi:unnamed protein product, partial [Allacma fusca]